MFRDQQFSADMGSEAVSRIADIRALRASQFPEDAGPLAHPVQPQSYLRIDNFYTATVYNKGAELIRMMHTLLGRDGFRRGMDRYIERHDNSAATIPDFVAAMQDAGGVDLTEFARWYHQAGTPEITVEDRYDPETKSFELTITQKTSPTPGQPDKQPMSIPVAMGLIGPNGDEMPTRLAGEPAAREGTRLLVCGQPRQTFRFVDVAAPPVPSLLRDFSAPVKLSGVPLDRLKFLAIHDGDPVARWDAGQRAAIAVLLERVALWRAGQGTSKRLPQFDAQQNMTDVLAALSVLTDIDSTERRAALTAFYQRWQDDLLVVDKWFALQARSALPGTIAAVRGLTRHSAFTRSNPNRLRALVGTFAQGNQLHFHDAGGAGYQFLADEVLPLDPGNPQVAARMVQPLGQWRRFDPARQALMKAQLQRIHDRPGLSTNTFEMVSKSLAEG